MRGCRSCSFAACTRCSCLRVPYWIVFPSLPPFTLKQVLGTVGRRATPNEIVYFSNWRISGRMLRPRSRRFGVRCRASLVR